MDKIDKEMMKNTFKMELTELDLWNAYISIYNCLDKKVYDEDTAKHQKRTMKRFHKIGKESYGWK